MHHGTTTTRILPSEFCERIAIIRLETCSLVLVLVICAPTETFVDNASRRAFDKIADIEELAAIGRSWTNRPVDVTIRRIDVSMFRRAFRPESRPAPFPDAGFQEIPRDRRFPWITGARRSPGMTYARI